MVVNTRPLKRLKKRVIADLFDFLAFPVNQGFGNLYDGPFRSNIRSFLAKFAQIPQPSTLLSFPHLQTWQIVFRIGAGESDLPATVTLNIVEEDVTRSRSVYCDLCRVVEYAYTLEVNEKSDVYSSGVVMLERVIGKKLVDPCFGENKDMVKWVNETLMEHQREKKSSEECGYLLLDQRIPTSYHQEMMDVLNVALLSTSYLPINRSSMRRAVDMLRHC